MATYGFFHFKNNYKVINLSDSEISIHAKEIQSVHFEVQSFRFVFYFGRFVVHFIHLDDLFKATFSQFCHIA